MRYFRIYHKKSKAPLTRLNEKDIVNFCIKNKETLSHYYFSELGSSSEKNLLEWSAFALKYKELFEEKTKEREEKEKEEFQQTINKHNKSTKKPIVIFLILIIVGIISGIVLFNKKTKKTEIKKVKITKQHKKEKKISYPLKRKAKPQDTKFTNTLPKTSTLIKQWKTQKTIKSKLDPKTIKTQMDLYIPDFKICFENRIKAKDKNLHGELRLKIRISGDGIVRDVLIESDKFRSTYFGDCIIKAIKSKKFPMFNAKIQIFTYYYNI
jgi:hypothetical protein